MATTTSRWVWYEGVWSWVVCPVRCSRKKKMRVAAADGTTPRHGLMCLGVLNQLVSEDTPGIFLACFRQRLFQDRGVDRGEKEQDIDA